ncbi:protein lifeguard 1-like [Panonychus citri]|uniref:protein lifeguard 1-like n=1 Tax=Panonychus citri TaxID=50023 RepID=UPI002307A873|nr:protein lifeguard 1-like [Panonychus citri]
MYNSYGGGEAGLSGEGPFDAFSEKSVRLAFIRKVYGIVCCQLIVTMAFVVSFSASEGAKAFVAQNIWLSFVALGGALISLITLACCGVHRTYPANIVCLGIFTLCESFMLGIISASKSGPIVMYAVIVTTVIVIGLTLFAFQTKIDFTMYSGIMFVVLMVFMLFGFIAMFFPGRIITLIYSGVGTLIFSIYLVIDTQMIVGGSHKQQFSPEDYILAAITIYTDIINIFIYVLQLLDMLSRD